MITATESRFISAAIQESIKSPVLMRHGAVAVTSGKIMGRGYNHYRTNSKDNFISNTCTCHAEIACLRNMFHTCTTNTYGKHSNNIKVGYQE
jgi:tRNA(Arg) A34 adenosine deaminase TadA